MTFPRRKESKRSVGERASGGKRRVMSGPSASSASTAAASWGRSRRGPGDLRADRPEDRRALRPHHGDLDRWDHRHRPGDGGVGGGNLPVLRDGGAKIFPQRCGVQGPARARAGHVPTEVLERRPPCGHQGVVGDRPLKEAKTRLVIPSYDVNTGKVYLFKTPHRPWYSNHADLPAVDVALATSAAPPTSRRARFPAEARSSTGACGPTARRWWAGRGTRFPGRAPEQVRMLSLSTTSYPFRLDSPLNSEGWQAGRRRSSTRSCSAGRRRP